LRTQQAAFSAWEMQILLFIVIQHNRRRIVHFNVTSHPTAEWTAQQVIEAFPFDSAPKYRYSLVALF